ncbi:MAG: hypothetical protein ACQEP5_04995 [Actinomycetota bacterium]
MNSVGKGRLAPIAIIFLTVFLVLVTGCMRETKYTYEEYRKLKAFQEASKDLTENGNDLKNDLQSYHRDLDNYNAYLADFAALYNKYYEKLIPLMDSFDQEQENLDRKNEYAESIKQSLDYWLEDLDKLDPPGFMQNYHNYFLEYLNQEILFYISFLQGEPELATSYSLEANIALENSNEELQTIKDDFRKIAQELGLEPPF